ncbi:MAG: hypothetical protein EZS28_013890, partial [Streblomastix strix]
MDLFQNYNVTLDQLKFDKCIAYSNGGAMYINVHNTGTLTMTGINIFQECEAKNGSAIWISLQNNQAVHTITGTIQINSCISTANGGGIYFYNPNGGTFNLSPSGSSNIFNLCTTQNIAGGFYSEVSQSGQLNINNTVFQDCLAQTGGGGGLYSSLSDSQLSVTNSQFIRCTTYQGGCAGAIRLSQAAESSISITSTSFTDCKTFSNPSLPSYGWGGAIYLRTFVTADQLTLSNFQMTQLSFSGCQSCVGIGNNIHIRSPNTLSFGQKIKDSSLLTVNNVNDLYTSFNYAYDYMGINNDNSDGNGGSTNPNHHDPLFEQCFTSVVPNPSYIDATNGLNLKYCGGQVIKCNTITYAIERNNIPPTGSAPSKNTKFDLILITIPSSDNNLQFILPTTYYNYITIQSNGYVFGGTGYTKYKIPSTSNSNSLFKVTDVGRLSLLGLLFENLAAASTSPLISIQSSGSSVDCFTTISCEFAHFGSQNLAHSIISVNGGKISVQMTTFNNYKFGGINTVFVIQSGSTISSIVDLVQVAFTDITQSGTGNGAAINSVLNSGSSLKTSVSSMFTRCKSTNGLGGAIYSTLSGGQIELNQTQFISCESKSGGAVYSTISGTG